MKRATPSDQDAAGMQAAREVLQRVWGYPSFRPGQEEVVQAVLEGRDVMAVLPTGGGKSICYQVPALAREGLTIVISPLIALMQDQVAGLSARGVGATFINSSLARREIEQRWIDAEFGRYRLLYMAPERLASDEFAARAPRMNIACVAVDEAHCISEWGHHFRPEYRMIADALESIARPQVIAVTATATPEVRADIVRQLRLRDPAVIVRGFDRPNITWSIFKTADRHGQVKRVLDGVPGTGILYGPTRRSVEEWAAWLKANGYSAAAYHGGMSNDRRSEVQEAWIQGRIRVIAATNAFGMGIDKPDVRFVIHDGIPASLEAYYQEAGRAGRDGLRSYAVLLYQPPDRGVQQSLIDSAHPSRAMIRQVYDAVMSLAQIAVGAEVDQPVAVDMLRVGEVTGLPRSIIQTSIDFLAREGLWTEVPTVEHRGYVRIDVPPAALRRYATNQRPRLRAFVEELARSVDGAAYADWYPVDLRVLSRRLNLDGARVDRGLRFLAEQKLIRWLSPEQSLLIQPRTPRYRKPPVDVKALKRSRRLSEQKLEAMVGYAESSVCRRRRLLEYFGEEAPERCGTCDVCLGRHDVAEVGPGDEMLLRRILGEIDDGRPVRRTLKDELREQDLARLLDWLERERLIRDEPAARAGYVVTDDGRRMLG